MSTGQLYLLYISINAEIMAFRTSLSGAAGAQSAHCSGTLLTIPTSLVFRSIGYRGVQISAEVPFDEKRGLVPSVEGRVLQKNKVLRRRSTSPFIFI